MTPKQMAYLMRRPAQLVRVMHGAAAPRLVHPRGPLIELLQAISPHDLAAVRGLVVDARLGYTGTRRFATASAALHWIRPSTEMIEGEWWPARSWMISGFAKPLTVDDLAECASSVPGRFLERYPRLRRRVHAASPNKPAG